MLSLQPRAGLRIRRGFSLEHRDRLRKPPEAHLIVEILDTVARIAAPSISLISGAMVPSAQASFIKPGECRGGYNSVLTSAVWEAIATADTRLLAQALADRSSLPKGCAWITYLRSHDDIGWWFDDDTPRPWITLSPSAVPHSLLFGDWATAPSGEDAVDGPAMQCHRFSPMRSGGLERPWRSRARADEIAIRRSSRRSRGPGDGGSRGGSGEEIAQLSDHRHWTMNLDGTSGASERSSIRRDAVGCGGEGRGSDLAVCDPAESGAPR